MSVGRRGPHVDDRKLTSEQARQLRADRAGGISYKALGEKYGLTHAAAYFILHGKDGVRPYKEPEAQYHETSSEMIERVALATCSMESCRCAVKREFTGMPCLRRGRNALRALREPTEAMLNAGYVDPDAVNLQWIWPAMVDAALKEES
jgi:hypothetical protein